MSKLTEYTMSVVKRARRFCMVPLLIILSIALPATAQQPFSDGESKGSLFLETTGGFVQFNAADPSIRIGYMYDESRPYLKGKNKRFDRMFGFGVFAKLTGSQGSFLGNNKIAANAGFNVSGGWKFLSAKKFDPELIPLTTEFLAGVQRKLRSEKTISETTKLPTPAELAGFLTNAVPDLTLSAKGKFAASLTKAIKSLGDGTELKAFVAALMAASNPEQAANLRRIVDNLEEKERVKKKLEELAAKLETIPTLAECVAEIEAAKTNNPGLDQYIDKTELDTLKSRARVAASFDGGGKVKALLEKPNWANYRDAIDSLCLVLDKKDSFCELKGKDVEISGIPKFEGYGDFDRLVFQGGYNFRQYNLFDPAAPFADQFSKKDFHNPSAQLIYNYRWGGTTLFGIGAGLEKANNAGDLTEIDIRDYITATSGPTTREFGRSRKALLGNFRQYTRSFVNTDLAYFPPSLKGRVGVNFFTRSEMTGLNKGFRPGVGVFLTEKGKPTKIMGGVSVSLDENRHAMISLITGYNF